MSPDDEMKIITLREYFALLARIEDLEGTLESIRELAQSTDGDVAVHIETACIAALTPVKP